MKKMNLFLSATMVFVSSYAAADARQCLNLKGSYKSCNQLIFPENFQGQNWQMPEAPQKVDLAIEEYPGQIFQLTVTETPGFARSYVIGDQVGIELSPGNIIFEERVRCLDGGIVFDGFHFGMTRGYRLSENQLVYMISLNGKALLKMTCSK